MKIDILFTNYVTFVKASTSTDNYKFVKVHSDIILATFKSLSVLTLSEVNFDSLQKLIESYKLKGNSINTINKRIGIIKRMLKYNRVNIPGVSDFPKIPFKRKSFKIIPENELKIAINYFRRLDDSPCNLQKKIMFFLFLYTGARLKELINIRVKNIDFINHAIILEHTKTGDPRVVFFNPLEDETFDLQLKKYILLKERDLLFWNFRNYINRPFSTEHVEAMFFYVKNLLGLSTLRPHNLRHTMATLLVENGASLKSIQELLGHKNLETTQIYLHMSVKRIKKDYDSHFPKI